MSVRILHIVQTGSPHFPRFAICDRTGQAWTGSAWDERPLLFADLHVASNHCAELQRRELVGIPLGAVVEVTIRFEVFGDASIDPEQLREWLRRQVHLEIDISKDSGPTDSVVLGSIDWPRYAKAEEASQ
jgi:hypothetical protein